MRLRLFTAAAFCGLSCVAHANTITQTFTVTFQNVSQTSENSDGFLQFNTQLGTLNSARADFSGNILFVASAPNGKYTLTYAGFAGGGGSPALVFSDTMSELFQTNAPVDPGSVTGSGGFANYFLAYIDLSVASGTVLAGSTATGTLTYNYTPVSTTPEPSSFALLSTGLFAVVGVVVMRYVHLKSYGKSDEVPALGRARRCSWQSKLQLSLSNNDARSPL